MAHLSRLGEELVLWASQEFGFVRLPRGLLLGLLDHAAEDEPRRPRAGARQGRRAWSAIWSTLLTVLKGLPLAYNKDLQETQEPLYDAVETALAVHAHAWRD